MKTNCLYKNEACKNEAYNSYEKAMKLWPLAYKELWVDTPYGETHIIETGDSNAEPVFLIPGLFADATMWYANVKELAKSYRVLALDMVNYGGKSRPSDKKINCVKDYTLWFKSIMDHFGYEKAILTGLSYGSWVALELARTMPESVKALILLDPSQIFIPMDGGIAWRGFLAFVLFPNRAKYRRFFTWLGGGYSDDEMEVWFNHMLNVIEKGSVKMNQIPQHKIYKREDLTMITAPTLILSGGKAILYKKPERFASAAKKALPHAFMEIIPEAGHILNIEKAEEINKRIITFLKARQI